MEIDEQSDLPFAQAHIGEQLSLVDGIDGFNALHLDNHSIGDDQINAITEIDVLSIVDDWQSDLTGNRDALFPKLVQQAGMICAFQQSRPEYAMNLHGRSNDLAGDVICARNNLLRCGSHEPSIPDVGHFAL